MAYTKYSEYKIGSLIIGKYNNYICIIIGVDYTLPVLSWDNNKYKIMWIKRSPSSVSNNPDSRGDISLDNYYNVFT